MRKVLLLAILASILTSSIEAQDIMNIRMNRTELGMRGDVTALDEDNLYKKDYFRDDWPSRKWFRTDLRQFLQEEQGHVYTFTAQGNLQQVSYTRQGVQVTTTRCSYAKNGLLTSFQGEDYRIEGKYKDNSGDFNVYAAARDYGNKVDLTTADLSAASYKTEYPFAYKCRQQLSDDGLVLKSTYYYVDSTLARQTEYTYSADGRIAVQRDKVYAEGQQTPAVTVTSYTYDGHGFLVRKEVSGAGGTDTYTYTNNAMGDCVEMLASHPYGTETYTYQYEYDDYGNWTLRLTFKDELFDYATLRALTYAKGAKGKIDPDADGNTPADGDAYYDSYDPTAAHAAAQAAKKEKQTLPSLFKKNSKNAREEAQTAAPESRAPEAFAAAKSAKAQKKADQRAMEKQAKQIKKEAGMTAKEKARAQAKANKKAVRVERKEALQEAKAQAKANRVQTEKEATAKAKHDRKAAVAARRAAGKNARVEAKAQTQADKAAAKAATKQAKQAADAQAKQDKQDADARAKQAKQEADAAEKEAVREAKAQAKAQREAAKTSAKAQVKVAKAQAKAEKKAAKQAAKETQKQAVKAARKAA